MLLGYKKDRLQLLSIISITWFMFGMVSLVTSLTQGETNMVLPILYVAQAIILYGIYTYCKVNKYILIDKDYIQRNSLSKPKVHVEDILKVRKKGKIYFFYTPKRTLRINTKLLDKQALTELEDFIKSLPNAVAV
ncbi:MAG TPA: hypothetical protein VK050_05585 [Flavobacteriaceae bacterium]|nr:hypothetical protein [Flavobacteriaceae bacterium]